jgi:hypothetical protein
MVMKSRYLFILSLVFASVTASAQFILTGVTTESGKTTRLENVFVKELGSNHIALSDKAGKFSIQTAANHALIFTLPGYVSDTLFVIDGKPKNIELKVRGITLSSVDIQTANAPFNPEVEYAAIYEKSKFALSPSRIFGKESRDARRLKRYFKTEKEQREVDAIFTKTLVSGIVPLKGRDLDNFMSMYRPTLVFAQNSSKESMTVYINDSYRKFVALPRDKRGLQAIDNGN